MIDDRHLQLHGKSRADAVAEGVCAACRSKPYFAGQSRFLQEREWRQTGLCPLCAANELDELERSLLRRLRIEYAAIWALVAAVTSTVLYFAWRLS